MSTATPPPTMLDLAEGPPEDEPGRRRSAPWIAAGVAVGVTVLIAGGLAAGGRGPFAGVAGTSPDVLHIGTGFPGAGSSALVADKAGLRAGRYVLTGTLPSTPSAGTAWRLSAATATPDQVASLAASLGLTGEPQRDGDDWVVRDGKALLRVYAAPGLPFSFDASPTDGSCPSIPTDGYGGPDSAVGCMVAEPFPTTVPAPGPDEATLADLGRSLAAALGGDADVRVWTGTPYGGVTVEPSVAGVPTNGLGISLQASTDGVLAASGWLSAFTGTGLDRGDTYPLRPARDVFGDLAAMPQPAIACAEDLESTQSQLCGGDITVTGASYGLTLAFDDGTPVLVPAWLFATDGSDLPFAQVAVATDFLGDPADSAPGSGSGSGGSTPGSPGSAGTGTEPAPPAASDLPLLLEDPPKA